MNDHQQYTDLLLTEESELSSVSADRGMVNYRFQ